MAASRRACRLLPEILVFSLALLWASCPAFGQETAPETVAIDETNAAEWTEVASEAGRDGRIELSVGELELSAPLLLRRRGVQLVGVGDAPTRIRCSDAGKLQVQATDVIVANVTLERCVGGAAELFNADAVFDPFDVEAVYDFEPLRVTFSSVRFVGNSEDPEARGHQGGALTIGPGTAAEVEDCEFVDNVAATGGAILVDGAASLLAKRTLFEANTATIAGGAIAAGFKENFFRTEQSIRVRNCRFVENRDTSGGKDVTGLTLGNGAPLENSVYLSFPSPAPSGGAIYVQGYSAVVIARSTFDGNTAVPAGGALYISDNDDVRVDECTFENNSVQSTESAEEERNPDLELGGAIYLVFTSVSSRAVLNQCLFRNNSASYGGVLHAVTELVTDLSFQNCQFEDNTAELSGGAVLLRNIIQAQFRNVRFYRNKATAGGGLALTNGAGAVFLKGPVPDIDLDIFFTENEALDGGAMFFLGAGQVALQNCRYNRNKAARNGGALCLIASLPSGQTNIQTNFFHSNAARRGGAVYVDGVSNLQTFDATGGENEFIKNVALAGGAVHIRPSSAVSNVFRISDASFRENQAVQSPREAGINGLDLPDVKVENTALGRKLLFQRTLDQAEDAETVLQGTMLDPSSADACHRGGGGALCLLTAQVPERSPVEVVISNVRLTENSAHVGGAIFASTSAGDGWIAACQSDGSAVESLTSSPCKSFSMSETEFSGNRATAAGGALFVSHPESVYVDGGGSSDLVQLSSEATSWKALKGNSVEIGGYGPEIATNALQLKILRPVVRPGDLLIEGHNSGDDMPEIELELLDAFEQRVTSGIHDSVMSIAIESDIVSGQRVTTANKGTVLFSKATALGEPIEHPMQFTPESSSVAPVPGRFSIRQCIVGESRIDDKNVCDICDEEYFGFNYNYTCDGCPDNAWCKGAAVLVPRNGYWHSTPYSPVMHECILEEACEYSGRRAALHDYYREPASLTPSNETVPEKEYRQCADEYTGPLCGSCVKGYGHVIDGECVECRRVWITAVLISVVCIWTLVLLVSTARAAFDTIREMHDMRLVRVLTMSTERGGLHRRKGEKSARLPKDIGRRSQTSTDDAGGSQKRGVTFDDDDAEASQGDQINDRGEMLGSRFTSQTGDNNVDHIMAAEKVSETIKILTNFFQITAVGVGINASWTESVRFLLIIEDSVSSISSGASFAPMECLFKNLDDRTLVGIVLRTLFPLVLTAVYILVNWLKHYSDKGNAKRRIIIGAIVGIFFAYDTVTEMLMRIVNCVTLDKPDVEAAEPPLVIQRYGIYAIARDDYWAEDTKHVCWEGNHGIVAGVLGVPGLIVFTFGIPFFLALFLLYKRYRGVVLEPECLNTYGFVYQSYQARFVFWESIIMLRKVSMAAVIVYAYDLGPNLQSAIALGILIFSLLAQFLAQPFKYRSLNVLESLSLLASIFIFYSGVVFRDANTSYAGKVILSIIIVTTNVLMVAFFIYRLLVTYDHLIIVKLRLENVENIPSGSFERVKLLSKINAAKIKDTVQEKLQKRGKSVAASEGEANTSPADSQA